ncbi:hypothetical protein [Mycobacterium phage WXIN]|nr:hypothetical protein [Mycobacterium phage WXIN]
MKFSVAIPFRDRGRDRNRPANLKRVVEHWRDVGVEPRVVSDGRSGDEQFCRSAAYNIAAREIDADILVYSESDLIVPFEQILEGVELAASAPGLVVPFSRFMAVEPRDSEMVRQHLIHPVTAFSQQVRGNCQSIGAVNIVSRASIDAIGQWPEEFEGAWFDDDACERAFQICCGATRFIDGDAYHLYHLPGAQGEHLTDADRAATAANQARFELYCQAETAERIRELTAGGR